MTLTLREVAELVQGRLVGDGSIVIDGVGPIESAAPSQLAALDSDRFLEAARRSTAAALLCTEKLAAQIDRPRIVTPVPQIAQNRVIERLGLWQLPWTEAGRHPAAIVDPTALLGDGVMLGPCAVVGARARIGAGTRLYPHAVVEPDATIGARCRVHSHAVVCSPATIGDDCVIGHGAIVAGEGFGFGFGPTGAVRLRHLGRVVIGNRVDIGNHTTIDRARFGDTRVDDDVKLDSHVHLGHNVAIGERTICAAFTGIAGSSTIGADCLLGGQSGVTDHVDVTNGCRFAARSGIGKSITEPGDYFGFWVKERRVGLREMIATKNLPDALKALEKLEAKVADLERKLGAS